jgi:NADH:ubiquinone reductase (H+-translocating)
MIPKREADVFLSTNIAAYEVVILGSGYAGLMAALGLAGRNPLKRIALISERDAFVERIRLQENVSGPVVDRMPPLPKLLANSKITFIRGRIDVLDAVKRCVHVEVDGEVREIAFDRCIYALGSSTDWTLAAGIDEHAYRLDPGDGVRSAIALRSKLAIRAGQALRVVVVGGANTATEIAGEVKSTWPKAEVTMISRSRAGDFQKGGHLESVVRSELQSLGVRLIDGQTVTEVKADGVVMASGETFSADICVWAAGLRSSSIAREAGLAVDDRDRIWADPTLSSSSHPHILAVGDAVHPLAPTGARYRMSAFAAIITGAYAAKRIVDEARGRNPRPFSYSAYGQGVAIGHSGVGFFSFPDDTRSYFVIRGQLALRIRNVFVWALIFFLKLERRFPGSSLFWIGRRRVSWKWARQARGGAVLSETIQCPDATRPA